MGDVGSKMAFFVDVGAILRHVGGKMATKSAKMNQDSPTWAAKAIEVRSWVASARATGGGFARAATP